MKITGTVEIPIDEVDIEQVSIEYGKPNSHLIFGFGSLQLQAAKQKSGFQSLFRLCENIDHCLDYRSSHFVDNLIYVTFDIRQKTAEDQAA